MSDILIAVIIDVSRSRQHADRVELQRTMEAAFGEVNTLVDAVQPISATVGDEFQAAYDTLTTAVRATLLARLTLPEGIDCRFGLGRGELRPVGQGVAGPIQDGSAWWSAREAIAEAREREYAKQPYVRTWVKSAPDARGERDVTTPDAFVNAYLTTRDHLVTSMTGRERRLLLGQLLGKTQSELAEVEGITQSAVSQNLRRSGASAVLTSESLLH